MGYRKETAVDLMLPLRTIHLSTFLLNAVLSLNGESGTSLLLESGYGAWIAPGAKKELRFIPTKKLPADQYTIQLVIVTREGAEPLTRELNISLEGESMASRHMSLR